VTAAVEQLAEVAQSAMSRGDWAAARIAFETLVEREPTAESLFGLGDVLWWLGETAQAVGYQQRAYAAYRRRGDGKNAAMTAAGLYLTYRVSLGKTAVADGWLGRAARLVEDDGLTPLAGWIALLRAHDSNDPSVAEQCATDAYDAARAFGDIDLELCALSQLGAALVQRGRLLEGTRLLDEAAAAALAGEARRPHTAVYTSCNMISSCAQVAEFEHALQWIHAGSGFEQRFGNPHLYTTCRTYKGTILFASGDWTAAEHELTAALDVGSAAEPDLIAEATARLADLRLAQGRIEDAERLLQGLDDHPSTAGARAGLAIIRGNLSEARRIALRRSRAFAVETPPRTDPYRPGASGPLEEASVWEVLIIAGEGIETEEALRRLEELAVATRYPQIQARALAAAGWMHSDVASLERALSMFSRLRLPLAAARVRMTLAGILTGGDAIAEARAALAAFEELGAARDADTAAACLRELGVIAPRGGPASLGALTRREREILELLGEGLTNRELADRLFLSRKTIERHVRNVLFKLGLHNRTQAAAYVVRHRSEIRSTD
jgi:DNA-binding NarL/FixJ family response regulator